MDYLTIFPDIFKLIDFNLVLLFVNCMFSSMIHATDKAGHLSAANNMLKVSHDIIFTLAKVKEISPITKCLNSR